ncbi:hypothetical protein [Streptomyces sparsus]
MNMNMPIARKLGRAALFSLVRGTCWALGSALAAGIVWWVQHQ